MTRVFCDRCQREMGDAADTGRFSIRRESRFNPVTTVHVGDLCPKCYAELLVFVGAKSKQEIGAWT